jgi:SRSO17 transposase
MPRVSDFYFCWKPVGVILQCVTDFKGETGLDHYQVRTWRAWYAHITLSMLALAWLSAARTQAAKGESAPASRAWSATR